MSLRLECCVCGGLHPEALIGWWYADTGKRAVVRTRPRMPSMTPGPIQEMRPGIEEQAVEYAADRASCLGGPEGYLDDHAELVMVAAPELRRGNLCSRFCARAFEGLTGGKVEPSPYLRIRKASELGRRAA